MNGYCDSCDTVHMRLFRKGTRWLCSWCLEREL